MAEELGIEGHHLDSERRELRSHVDEVIVQANKQLAHPETFSSQRPPDLSFVRHLNLDSNHMFLMLKRQLAKYYEEKLHGKTTMHPGKSEQWQELLYASLLKALMELTFAEDKEHQMAGLDHIYKWFVDKTRISLPQLQKSTKVIASVSVPRSVLVSQDNTMRGRRQRMLTRKMDAVKSIESRSPSPTRATPSIDKTDSLWTEKPLDYSKDEDQYNSLFIENKTKEQSEVRTSFVHHKLVNQWSVARSRMDERLLAKAEISAAKPRVVKHAGPELWEDTSSEASDIPGHHKNNPGLVDMRRTRTQSDTPAIQPEAPEDDVPFRPLTKIERARYVHRVLMQGDEVSSFRGISPDRLSLSFYSVSQSFQPTNRSATPAVPEPSYGEADSHKIVQISDIRRKLATRQIPCTYRTLSDGLAKPPELPARLLNHLFLPSGGEYLTSNPFSTLGKKKGKKGKKKKK